MTGAEIRLPAMVFLLFVLENTLGALDTTWDGPARSAFDLAMRKLIADVELADSAIAVTIAAEKVVETAAELVVLL